MRKITFIGIIILIFSLLNTFLRFSAKKTNVGHREITNAKIDYGYHHNLTEPPIGQYEAVLQSDSSIYMMYNYIRELIRYGRFEDAIQKTEQLKNFSLDKEEDFNYEALLLEIYLKKGLDLYGRCTEPFNGVINDSVINNNYYFVRAKELLPKIPPQANQIFEKVPRELITQYQLDWGLSFIKDELKSFTISSNDLILSQLSSFPVFKPQLSISGLQGENAAGSSLMADFNNDGYLDIVESEMELGGTIKFYQNDGTGNFKDKSLEAGFNEIRGGMQLTQTDYNKDGWLDIFIARGAWMTQNGLLPNALLKNNGNGTFTEVTQNTGLYSAYPTQAVVWADFNNDGWEDLFIGNEIIGEMTIHSELYINNQGDTFSNETSNSGLNFRAWIGGVTVLDFNRDGLNDLFLTQMKGKAMLFRNDFDIKTGQLKFTNVSEESLPDNRLENGFLTATLDFDKDSFPDLVYSHKAGIEVLLNQNGRFFTKQKEISINSPYFVPTSLGIGDFNYDNFEDIYVGTAMLSYNRLLINNQGKGFIDGTTISNLTSISQGNGISIGDIDNDGDDDIYIVNGGFFPGEKACNMLYLNTENN